MAKNANWKDIKGFEGYYQYSKHGHVKSLARKIACADGKVKQIRERVMTLCANAQGEFGTVLSKDGDIKKWFAPKYEHHKYF